MQADNDAESEGEEMGALGSLFVEVESGEAVGTVLTEPGDWINSEQQQATQEATLQVPNNAFHPFYFDWPSGLHILRMS